MLIVPLVLNPAASETTKRGAMSCKRRFETVGFLAAAFCNADKCRFGATRKEKVAGVYSMRVALLQEGAARAIDIW